MLDCIQKEQKEMRQDINNIEEEQKQMRQDMNEMNIKINNIQETNQQIVKIERELKRIESDSNRKFNIIFSEDKEQYKKYLLK